MPHWAELDENNVVRRVIVCDADDGADGTIHPPKFCTDVLGGTWARTYYSTAGKYYAGIGYSYVPGLQNFRPPSPHPSWKITKDQLGWEAPKAMPQNGGPYRWDEPTLSWVATPPAPS